MVFACQRDSFLRELRTTVVSIEKASKKLQIDNKTQKIDGYELILEDTVLFPEGGGQPFDRGTVNGYPVLTVSRIKEKAVHFVTQLFEVGDEVELVVDWKRRFDHMQQHSGQHLISAVAERLFNYKTTSWNLGEENSFIELDTTALSNEELNEIETACNESIRKHLDVEVKVYQEGAEELKQAKTRGLPEDHTGPVRVICIQEIDENMCCGTHVSNLSQLQVIKLLWFEKGKKGKSNLFFLVGDRVINFVAETTNKNKLLTAALQCGPSEHVKVLGTILKAYKISQKNELSFIRDLALSEASKFKSIEPLPRFFSLHRKDGNFEFMNTIIKEIANNDVLIFLTIGEQNSGQMMLVGENSLIKELGPKVMEMLDGKGGTNGNKFNGKFSKMNRRQEAENFLREALKEM